MTSNQIAYYRAREEERSNRTREVQTSQSLAETRRHNQAQEELGWGDLSEKQRSNRVNEFLKSKGLTEEQRHNLASERVQVSDVERKQLRDAWEKSLAKLNTAITAMHFQSSDEAATVRAKAAEAEADIRKQLASIDQEKWDIEKKTEGYLRVADLIGKYVGSASSIIGAVGDVVGMIATQGASVAAKGALAAAKSAAESAKQAQSSASKAGNTNKPY